VADERGGRDATENMTFDFRRVKDHLRVACKKYYEASAISKTTNQTLRAVCHLNTAYAEFLLTNYRRAHLSALEVLHTLGPVRGEAGD